MQRMIRIVEVFVVIGPTLLSAVLRITAVVNGGRGGGALGRGRARGRCGRPPAGALVFDVAPYLRGVVVFGQPIFLRLTVSRAPWLWLGFACALTVCRDRRTV